MHTENHHPKLANLDLSAQSLRPWQPSHRPDGGQAEVGIVAIEVVPLNDDTGDWLDSERVSQRAARDLAIGLEPLVGLSWSRLDLHLVMLAPLDGGDWVREQVRRSLPVRLAAHHEITVIVDPAHWDTLHRPAERLARAALAGFGPAHHQCDSSACFCDLRGCRYARPHGYRGTRGLLLGNSLDD